MRAPAETAVLIAGGGPSGLAAAVELGLRGIDCVLVEPRTMVDTDRPRAKTTSVRTMEHFRRWGLAEAIRAAAPLPVAWSQDAVFCTSLLGAEITRFHGCFGLSPERVDLFAESGQQIAQPLVERVMRDAVNGLGSVTALFGQRVTGIAETDTHVDVELDSEHTVRARYVLGCDGASSLARTAIGARYLGSADSRPNLNIVFRAPGLAERVPHGPAVHYWVINQEVPGVLGRLDLDSTWFASIGGIGEGNAVDCGRLLRGLVGIDVPFEVISTDHWTARMLLADRFASDRVFLVGDAAHLNPPWGGHGFNTGVGDAVNIGWKLAAVLSGWGGPELLRSYASERRYVAARTIEVSSAHLRRAPLDLAGPVLAEEIQSAKRSEFHSLGLVLGYHYANSPIVSSVDTALLPAGEDYRPQAYAGARLPHAWLPDGRSLYDLLGRDYTLLRLDPTVDPTPLRRAAKISGVPLDVVDFPTPAPDLYGEPLVLVRPDQHLAWRGKPDDPASTTLFDLVRGASHAKRSVGRP